MVVGGFDGKERLKTVEILDLETMVWSSGPQMREERSGCGVVVDAQGKMIIVGGHNGKNQLKTLDIYEGKGMGTKQAAH